MRCRYCPQLALSSAYRGPRRMTMVTFERCMETVPADVRIDFAGFSEPWVNPDCGGMLNFAAAKGHPISMYTTLVGVGAEDLEDLAAVEYNEFVLHLPDAEGNSPMPTTKHYVDLVRQVLAAKIRTRNRFSISCHGTIHPALADLVAGFPFDNQMIDRAGHLDIGPKTERSGERGLKCGISDLNCNVLLPDGSVVLCCMDYGLEYVLGNLLAQDYAEIRDGATLRQIREKLASGEGPLLCHRCGYLEGN
jgi:hypothetical protein